MTSKPLVTTIHAAFFRHERRYCLFAVSGRKKEFLYFSHTTRPLRSLMAGNDLATRLPELLENRELCIECGLGLSITGGAALDDGGLVAWGCTIEDANALLESLKDRLGEDGKWIELF